MRRDDATSHVAGNDLLEAVERLRAGEDVIGVLAAHTPVGIFVSDVEGKAVYVNERWCELAGMSPDEALGDGWRAALHQDDAQQVNPEWDAAAEAGRDSVAEYRFVRPDGSVSWIEGYASALHDNDGQLLGWVGTCLDLTARKEAEEQFRRAFDEAPIGMALVSPGGRWLQVNVALCRLLGYQADELTEMTFMDVTHRDDLEASLAHSRRQLEGETDSAAIQKRFVRRDGGSVWVSMTSTLVRDTRGGPSHFVAQVEDVTERVLAQKALREAEERFRRAFDDAPIGMALLGLDGRWQRVNSKLCEITGHGEDALLGRTFAEITHPDDVSGNTEGLERLVSGQLPVLVVEKRYLRPDGKTVWVRVSSSLVRDADGAPAHVVAQIEDISDRRRTEHRLKELADHDPLTGLLNRRRLDEELRTTLLRIRRHGGRAALLLFDIDRFKTVNDSFGHKAGDDVLCALAGILRGRLRATDVVARLGGDEFAVLLFEASPEDARRVADELAASIRAMRVPREGGHVSITVSAGVVLLDPQTTGDEDEALVAADRALYTAKRDGRDRVALAA